MVRLRMLRGSTGLYRTLSFFISHAVAVVKPCFRFPVREHEKSSENAYFRLTEAPGFLIIIEKRVQVNGLFANKENGT